MRKFLFPLCAVAATFLAVVTESSCDKKIAKRLDGATPSVSECDTITYTKHIRPIISVSCSSDSTRSCHTDGGVAGGVTLDTYDQVKNYATAGNLRSTVFDGMPYAMPPSDQPQLTQKQKNLINCWLNNGKKN